MLNINLIVFLNYDCEFLGGYFIGVMVGVIREIFIGEGFFVFRRNFIFVVVDQLFVGGIENQDVGGSVYECVCLGYYGCVQYNYKEIYLVEFIWCYDGFYIFLEFDCFGFFLGVLLGWNLMNEFFFDV